MKSLGARVRDPLRRQERRRWRREARRLREVLHRYVLAPHFDAEGANPFNGQQGRRALFDALWRAWQPRALVETGTFLGESTGYMAAATGLAVWSVELDPDFAALARLRLAALGDQVRIVNADSRAFLHELAAVLPPDAPLLLYLDAHWHADLPLVGEVETIAAQWRDFVVVVDDFAVPGDPGYGYDRYGDTALDLTLLAPVLRRCGLRAFFPTLPSREETGARRGCVVLAPSACAERLQDLPLLAPAGAI